MEQAIKNVIVAIGDTDPVAASLMVELVMPTRMTANRGAFEDLDDLATYFSSRAGDYAKDAYKDKRWDGELREDGTLGVTHKPTKAKEESE